MGNQKCLAFVLAIHFRHYKQPSIGTRLWRSRSALKIKISNNIEFFNNFELHTNLEMVDVVV